MAEARVPIAADGRCLCGKARYHLTGDTDGIIYCHCQRCRKHTGAAAAPFVMAAGTLRWDSGRDAVETYTHDVSTRAFCTDCGSSMPVPHDDANKLSNIHAGTMLDMPAPPARWHLFTASSAPWYDVPRDGNCHAAVAPGHEAFDPKLPDLQRFVDADRITGSCLCGKVGFSASRPVGMMNCHCTRCRLSRGAAHATNLFVERTNFEWRSGEDLLVRYKLPGAKRFGVWFCSECGSLLPRDNGQRMNIPAGCLDSDPGIGPAGHIYTGSMAPWFAIHDPLPQWRERPG